MSVRMRLKRFGSKKRPDYRIVVMDSRAKAQGRTLDEVGQYHPLAENDQQIILNEDKIREWLSKGVQPSDTVRRLLNKSGVHITRTIQE
ncbi:MAG TPA: 30S ribosomal protein S16 [Sphaerochaeta sp.]|jgi:small subunit ribosomal protein S16|nr:30S ribosomal protein S16 [Sphaerochaeta sp.]HPZ16045.1 30S ribosomal protein S16 [Sphaerochaeta sp.]